MQGSESEAKTGVVEPPFGGYWGMGGFAVLLPWWALMHQVIVEQSGVRLAFGLLPGALIALPFAEALGEWPVWILGIAATAWLVWLGRCFAEKSGLALLALFVGIAGIGGLVGSLYRM